MTSTRKEKARKKLLTLGLPPTSEAARRYFAVNDLIQQWTLVHLAFHSLALVALGNLVAAAKTPMSFLVTTSLAGLGVLSAVVSIFKDERNEDLRFYWEESDRKHFDKMRSSQRWQLIERSRLALFIFILLFYAGLGGFPWLNANNYSEPTRAAIEAANTLQIEKLRTEVATNHQALLTAVRDLQGAIQSTQNKKKTGLDK